MDFERQVSRMLHQEHLAVIGLMGRFRDYLSENRASAPPKDMDARSIAFLGELTVALENEIRRHFVFEETELFPRLAEAGEPGIGELLHDEHEIMRPLANEIVRLGRAATDGGWTEQTWMRFHELGTGLSGMLISHIQKETMGLLPLLEEILDDETDGALSLDYAEG